PLKRLPETLSQLDRCFIGAFQECGSFLSSQSTSVPHNVDSLRPQPLEMLPKAGNATLLETKCSQAFGRFPEWFPRLVRHCQRNQVDIVQIHVLTLHREENSFPRPSPQET